MGTATVPDIEAEAHVDADALAVEAAKAGADTGTAIEHEARNAVPVTVVVATMNRRDELLRTLGRLTVLPERPAVIVVDNGSTDGTGDAVRHRYPEVQVIRLSRNIGAPARNIGVKAARTPYVAFADDDSWWEPGALTLAARTLDAHPRLGLVAAQAVVGKDRRPDPINEALAAAPHTDAGQAGPPVLGFLACASVMRRRAFLDAGGFSPLLFFPGEEQLLAYDLAALGWERCYVSDVVAVHQPSVMREPAPDRRRAQMRNALLTTWLRRSLHVAVRETARLAARSLRDLDSRAALLGALRRMPHALRDRRPLPFAVEAEAGLLEAVS